MSKKDFQFDALLKPEEAASYLRSIADGLDNRLMRIAAGDDAFDLDVPESVEFRISAKFRDGEQRVRAQFTFRDEPLAGAPELNIE